MPKTPSKQDSVVRRGPIKAHQPFRGNDLEHGKKTGKTVTQVSRDADDFEPFDKVLDQAYKDGTGPRPPVVRSKAVNGGTSRRDASSEDDENDDSGEVSMDIDSVNDSPSAYFNATATPPPPSVKRVGSSSSRPLPQGSGVDYDRIPSPKTNPRRSSIKPRSKSSQPLHPSRLRNEVQLDEDEEHGVPRAANKSLANGNQSVEDIDYDGNDNSYGQDDDDPSLPHNSPNMTALPEEDDSQMLDMDIQMSPSTPSRRAKGKQRALSLSDSDAEAEEDIVAGMAIIEQAATDEEAAASSKPSTSRKLTNMQSINGSNSELSKKQTNSKQPKRVRQQPRISTYENVNEEGLRRGKRQRYRPLEYWRQERVVWGRRTNGRSVVPVIKEIITIPKPEPESLGSKKRKRSATHAVRSKSRSHATPMPGETVEEIRIVEVEDPEAGWDNDTQVNGIIIDWGSRTEVERRVAYPQRLVKPHPAGDNKYSFHKVFGDGDFVAAGQLVIPPGQEKPPKPTKDNTYIFYIVQGAVECKVHRTSFVLATGGMFMVPRGNQYYIKNICEREVKIFFAQARKVPTEDLEAGTVTQSPVSSRARTAPQSPSRRVASTNG